MTYKAWTGCLVLSLLAAVNAVSVHGEESDEAPRGRIPKWAKVGPQQIKAAKDLDIPVAFENEVGMRFVLIPAGTFVMGSDDGEQGRDRLLEVRHPVTLTRPFYLQITEVTTGQFKRFRPKHVNGGSMFQPGEGSDRPVVNVSIEDVADFLAWLSEKCSDRPARLPTEAEWEYACRAGSTSTYSTGETITVRQANFRPPDGAADLPETARHRDGHYTTHVSTYPVNAWGLYDMHGNVAEMCADDVADPSTLSPDAVTDPSGTPRDDKSKVVRGGSWISEAVALRSAAKSEILERRQIETTGFRLALTIAVTAEAPPEESGPHVDVTAHVSRLRSEDAGVRSSAANLLARDQRSTDAVVTALTELLSSGAWRTRFEAARALGELGSSASGAVLALIKVLRDENVYSRGQAAESLGKIGSAGREGARALALLLLDPKPETRDTVELVFRNSGGIGPSCVEPLLALLKTGSTAERVAAGKALGLTEHPDWRVAHQATGVLLTALENKDAGVRESAAFSLGRVLTRQTHKILPQYQKSLRALADALQDESPAVRIAAAGSMEYCAEYGPHQPPEGKGAEYAQKRLVAALSDEDPAVRVAVARAVGRFLRSKGVERRISSSVKKAVRMLEDLRKDEISEVRDAAEKALELIHWKPPALTWPNR